MIIEDKDNIFFHNNRDYFEKNDTQVEKNTIFVLFYAKIRGNVKDCNYYKLKISVYSYRGIT